ncbi:MAG: SemiSWEET family transporter [Candidatus Falkowbacteria bacterium]
MIFKKIESLFTTSIEYQDYLLHGTITAINLALIVAIISASLQAWGIFRQNKLLKKNKSATALPLSFFAFQFFYFMAYLIYGLKIGSISLMISNVVGVLFLPIIITLVKFKQIENASFKNELLISPLLALIIPCVVFIRKEWSLIAVLILATIVFTHLVIEIIRKREIRNIEPRFIISFILCSLVWLWYGIEISDFGLITSSATTVSVGIAFSFFYLFMKRSFKKSPATIN